MPTINPSIAAFIDRYDKTIFDPEARALYGGSGFFNVGDWSSDRDGPPRGLAEAGARLVMRHMAADAGMESLQTSIVLDVGCGLGAGTAMLARHYSPALVLGLNLSPAQVAYAAHAAPDARFAVMDGARMAIAEGSIARVHCIEAAFHFDTRDNFLLEAHRVLRPGGKLLVTDIQFRTRLGDVVPEKNIWTGEAEYRKRCRSAGFIVESLTDVTDCTLTPFYAFLMRHGQAAKARAFRRAQQAYLFAVLRKPDWPHHQS